MFSADFFIGNRNRLRELFTGTAPIVLAGNGVLQRGADAAYPFQQDANFWYFTGIDEPDAILVLDKAKDYIILPFREGHRATFDGETPVEDVARRSGIETIYDAKEGWKQLGNRLKKVRYAATIAAPPTYLEAYGMYTNPARRRLLRNMKAQNDGLDILDISEHVVRLRMVKQPLEIEALSKAIAITSDAIKDAMKPQKRSKYAFEYEIEAELIKGFRGRGARGHAFDPIVAAGKNATTIHYVKNDGALSADELVVMDVGAEYDHYAADITRTFALGEPSRRQQQVFDAVVEVQQYAYDLLKPGVTMQDYEQKIEQYMGESLRELGLIKTIEHDSVRTYYPHATSHHLGLNVHDIADYDRPLEPNMIITVEPGIYIPGEHIGIRIEDDVRITETGIEVLSSALLARLN